MNTLELKVVFAAVDKFVRPVKAITDSASKASKAFKDHQRAAQDLNDTLAKIDAYEKVTQQWTKANKAIHATKDRMDELQETINKSGIATEKQRRQLERLQEKHGVLSAQLKTLNGHEIDLRTALKLSGIETDKLATAREHLSSASAAATMNSMRLQNALDAENQRMKRLHAARAEMAKARELSGKLAMTGAGITAAGVAAGVPAAKSAKDFADFETAMLGVARQMDGARDDSGKVTRSYWEMAAAIKSLSERLPGAAADIAKIVEGGARMGIHGKENLLIYAEATAIMAKAFDLPVDQIGEDIGKLSQLYKVPIKDIRTLGDTINWLDDQALAKGGDIIDVMKRIAGTADMVKMNFGEAAALGSTFLSLGANPEVAASASNAMIRELSIANMQSKRFKGGLAMLGLDGGKIQSQMAKDATGTIIMVLEKIKALAGDKQLEAATRLFGKEFGDDASKLAANLDEYRRQLQLVKDQKAFGSMQREADAWGDTLNARIENAQNAFSNLSSDLGRHLKPAIAETLEKTLSVVQSVRAWADENPRLSAGLITVSKWLAIALSVIGAITVGAGALLIPLAALKFSMTTLGLSGTGAFGLIAGGIRTVGLALVANPIGLTLTGIATAAVLIYKNWDKIGSWFANLVDGILVRINKLKENLRYMFPGMFGDLKDTPTRASNTAAISSSPVLRQAAAGSNYTFNVYPGAGSDNQSIARDIRAEIERMDREKAARNRGRLRDTE